MHWGGILSWYNSWSFVIICNLGWLTVWFSIWARTSFLGVGAFFSSYTIVSGNILGWLLPQPGSSLQFKTTSQGQSWPVGKGKTPLLLTPAFLWLRTIHRYSWPAYSLSHLPLKPALRDGGGLYSLELQTLVIYATSLGWFGITHILFLYPCRRFSGAFRWFS